MASLKGGHGSTFAKIVTTNQPEIGGRPYKLSNADDYNILDSSHLYFTRFVWVRDFFVAGLYLAGAVCTLVGAVFLYYEAEVLKKDVVYADGDYKDGLIGWTLFYTGFVCCAVSNIVAVALTVTSHFAREVEMWWPEGEPRDLIRQTLNALCDIVSAVFAMEVMRRYERDFDDITSTTPPNVAAAKRTIQWQIFYGVERFENAPTSASMTTMGYDDVMFGLMVVFGVRLASIVLVSIVGQEKPFYLFPFCLNRNACKACGLGFEATTLADEPREVIESYIPAPCTAGGIFSRYIHNHLGAVRNHVHVFAILYFAAFLMLVVWKDENPHAHGYVPWKEFREANGPSPALNVPQCEYENVRGLPFDHNKNHQDWIPDEWKKYCPTSQGAYPAKTSTWWQPDRFTSTSATTHSSHGAALGYPVGPSSSTSSCRQPSLYVIQDPAFFLGTPPNKASCVPLSAAKISTVITGATEAVPLSECQNRHKSQTKCEHEDSRSTGCKYVAAMASESTGEGTLKTEHCGRYHRYAGLRLNQMSCFMAAEIQKTSYKPQTAGTDPKAAAGPSINSELYPKVDRERMGYHGYEPTGFVNMAADNVGGYPLPKSTAPEYTPIVVPAHERKHSNPSWMDTWQRYGIPAPACCPDGVLSAHKLTEKNDLGQAMWDSSVLFIIGAVFHVLSALAFASSLVLYGVSAIPSDVPRDNRKMCDPVPF